MSFLIYLNTDNFKIFRSLSVFIKTSFLLLLIISCFPFSTKASPYKEATTAFNQNIEKGKLPSSFASISEKLPSGKFKHLMGGVLIYPGVILTSTHHIDHLKETFPNYKIKEKNLYVILTINSNKNIIAKVMFVHKHGKFGTEESLPINSLLKDVALVFFATTSETNQIIPAPVITARERDLFMKQHAPPLLKAVGSYSYEPKELNSLKEVLDPHKLTLEEFYEASEKDLKLSLCPESTKTFIGEAQMRMSPAESSFLSETILARPGKSYLSKETEQRLSAYSRIIRQNQTSCGMPFCASPYSSPSEKQRTIQYFCSDHFGYPLLWKTPRGDYKIIGLTSSTKHRGILPLDLHTLPEVISPDIAQFIPWIKDKIIWYLDILSKVTKGKYNKTVPPVDDFFENTLIDTMISSAAKDSHSQYPESIVDLNIALGPDFTGGCKGILISEGVILTAAHCVDFSFFKKALEGKTHARPTIQILFQKKSNLISVKTNKVSLYDRFKKDIKKINHDSGATTIQTPYNNSADIALIFFQNPDDFPNIKPTGLATRKGWKLFLTDPEGSAMSGITRHGLSSYKLGLKNKLNFRVVSLDHYSLGRYWYQRILQEIHPERLRSFVIPRYEKITGLKFDAKKITQNFHSPHYHESRYSLSSCIKKKSICTTMKLNAGYLERSHYTCGGESGSPILIKNSHSGAWKVVGVLNSSASLGEAKVNGCGFAANSTNITLKHYQDWIHTTIKEHRKSTTSNPP